MTQFFLALSYSFFDVMQIFEMGFRISRKSRTFAAQMFEI